MKGNKMNYPELSKIVDLAILKSVLASEPPRSVLQLWAKTAGEIEPDKKATIDLIKSPYEEMDESELHIDCLLLFVEHLLDKFSSEENKLLLISTLAPNAINYPRTNFPS
jgi:hypothetical protein